MYREKSELVVTPLANNVLRANTKRTAQQSYYNCTIIGSLMRVLRFPFRAEFFPAEE